MAILPNTEVHLWRQRIAKVLPAADPPRFVLENGAEVIPTPAILRHLRAGDEIILPAMQGLSLQPQFLVRSRFPSGRYRDILLAHLHFVGSPKRNARGGVFLLGNVAERSLGINRIVFPQESVTSWFYQTRSTNNRDASFYTALRISPNASPAELRIAARIRRLEVEHERLDNAVTTLVERAFNILAHPSLRRLYDSWLKDPEAPLPFPYSGAGSIIVSGRRPDNGETFFADQILSFRPDLCARRLRIPLRSCDFFADHARYRDVGRKVEVWLDSSMLHTVWTPDWNQWKHHLGVKIEVNADFVTQPRFRSKNGELEESVWQIALPSRIRVRIPGGLDQLIANAQEQHRRFGRFRDQIEQIRKLIEKQPLERTELQRMCDQCGIPADFDITQITWAADYEPAFYAHLARASRRQYFFRSEYIFEMHRAIVVETPELGHATYVFRKPSQIEKFLALYATVSKQDIRNNRQNVAERLGFATRVNHGQNLKTWLKELARYTGESLPEPIDGGSDGMSDPYETGLSS